MDPFEVSVGLMLALMSSFALLIMEKLEEKEEQWQPFIFMCFLMQVGSLTLWAFYLKLVTNLQIKTVGQFELVGESLDEINFRIARLETEVAVESGNSENES